MNQTVLIKKPVISEQSFRDARNGVFSFIVEKDANKIELRKAIESEFKVHVTAITTEILKGKRKTVGKKRLAVKLGDIKKARVRLKKGEKIDLFEVGEK